MSEILFLVSFSSTKIGKISDMTKCLENFVSQTLGLFIKNYAAELRFYENSERNSIKNTSVYESGVTLHRIGRINIMYSEYNTDKPNTKTDGMHKRRNVFCHD